MPIKARNGGADVSDSIATKLEGLFTIIPAPLRPKNAKKNPMAAPIPYFKSRGIEFKTDSLKPEMVIIKKIIFEMNTAARAVCQVLPIPNISEYVNNVFRPMPGANPTGYFATIPIIIDAIPEETAVAKNTPVTGIPPSHKMIGFTPKI